MDIKILSSEEVEFKEKDVQKAFEHDLSKLEEGLEFIDSEVAIPVGRIDTLAFDTNTNYYPCIPSLGGPEVRGIVWPKQCFQEFTDV
jgi:RecB family endonuclease NucS